MQSNFRVIKAVFYLTSIAFLYVWLFTNAGNYLHGGTVMELIGLETVAVLISVTAIKLLPRVENPEKVLVALCAAVPIISIVWALFASVGS